jgi:hypothetical protein
VAVACGPTTRANPAAALRQETPTRIINASGVRVRSSPETTATEVLKLSLGALVRQLGRTPTKARVGQAEDYWYHVAAENGAEGWVFGALTEAYDPARRDQIYRRIAAARLANAAATFGDLAETVVFLNRAVTSLTAREALAELELARLQALGRSFASISIEDLEKTPYKQWAQEHEASVVYSEPAGQYFVNSERLWALREKYADLPFAERIAWEAAQTPLPGECEGYLPCYLYTETMTNGRYLKLYPRGQHAAAALGEIADFLSTVVRDAREQNPLYEVPAEDRAEFSKTLAELRAQLASVTHPRAAEARRLLEELARRFK